MLQRIKQLRQEKGFSQRSLAEQLGVSQQSINKYENHNIEPDIATLQQIADVFSVSIDYLVGYSDERLPVIVNQEDGTTLSSAECRLVSDYRQLSHDERLSIDLVIRNYLSRR